MKTKTSLVRANGVVELHTISPVHMDYPVVILPAYAENDRAIRLGHTLQNTCLNVFRIIVDVGNRNLCEFPDRLVKLGFIRVAPDATLHK